jgi:tRNA(Ile2) C34 agmatinyltransferase TiaS
MSKLNKVLDFLFREPVKVKCKVCNDTKEMEVNVMGSDYQFVECSYCSTKPEYKEFQEYVRNLNSKLYETEI